jgi:hypothetical protein
VRLKSILTGTPLALELAGAAPDGPRRDFLSASGTVAFEGEQALFDSALQDLRHALRLRGKRRLTVPSRLLYIV